MWATKSIRFTLDVQAHATKLDSRHITVTQRKSDCATLTKNVTVMSSYCTRKVSPMICIIEMLAQFPFSTVWELTVDRNIQKGINGKFLFTHQAKLWCFTSKQPLTTNLSFPLHMYLIMKATDEIQSITTKMSEQRNKRQWEWWHAPQQTHNIPCTGSVRSLKEKRSVIFNWHE